jgi:acetyl-CoA acetyltransferase
MGSDCLALGTENGSATHVNQSVIVAGARTPVGRLSGGLKSLSGARAVLHLALELKRRGGGTGAAALCGGGQGDALIVRVPRS